MSDLISRQDALDAVNDCGICIQRILDIPSAEPERTAKVKELDKRSETMMAWEGICTNCGSYTMHEMTYCFHCGCRLEW